jgi:hypothetical protein
MAADVEEDTLNLKAQYQRLGIRQHMLPTPVFSILDLGSG